MGVTSDLVHLPGARQSPHLLIEPSRRWVTLRLHELWEYRELLYFLIWRDIKVRYRQTVLGAAWAIIQPFMTMIVFSLFFGRLAHVPSDGVPYPLFSFAALIPWNFFAQSLGQASNSLVGSANLIRKVYFPRLVMPLSGVLGNLVDLAIAFVFFLGLMLFYRTPITIRMAFLPLFLLLAICSAIGVGVWLSALHVQYRDVRYVAPFMIQFLMFASPVAYSSMLLDEPWRAFYSLNPMAGVIDGFRWALLGTPAPGPMTWVSAGVSVVLLVSGVIYFRGMERDFADVV